jgi:hypothetical protein
MLHNSYSSQNNTRQIKSSAQGFGGKARRKKITQKNRGVDGKKGSEWILWRLTGGVDWIQLAQVAGCCECGDEP